MLDKSAITPLYIQLMNELEDKIRKEIYEPSEKLLTESEMSKKYGVSLITVRKALDLLTEKDLVERKQGKGTYVKKPKFSKNVHMLQSFSEMCEQMGVKPGAKMLENKIVKADEKTAGALGIDVESSVVYISRLRYANSEPVVLENNYFSLKYAVLLDTKFDDNSLFKFLYEKYGFKVSASEKVIELCKATSKEASALQVKKGESLLRVKSIAFDSENKPLYTGVQIINGDRFCLCTYEKV
ncbi:MAG: GntR family transcriptional regulator [Herbinix sp.]|nr:GntR family transcriptional regulator [Herbinix sp.]